MRVFYSLHLFFNTAIAESIISNDGNLRLPLSYIITDNLDVDSPEFKKNVS